MSRWSYVELTKDTLHLAPHGQAIFYQFYRIAIYRDRIQHDSEHKTKWKKTNKKNKKKNHNLFFRLWPHKRHPGHTLGQVMAGVSLRSSLDKRYCEISRVHCTSDKNDRDIPIVYCVVTWYHNSWQPAAAEMIHVEQASIYNKSHVLWRVLPWQQTVPGQSWKLELRFFVLINFVLNKLGIN